MIRSFISVGIHNAGSSDALTERTFLAFQKITTDNLRKPFYEMKIILFSTSKILES